MTLRSWKALIAALVVGGILVFFAAWTAGCGEDKVSGEDTTPTAASSAEASDAPSLPSAAEILRGLRTAPLSVVDSVSTTPYGYLYHRHSDGLVVSGTDRVAWFAYYPSAQVERVAQLRLVTGGDSGYEPVGPVPGPPPTTLFDETHLALANTAVVWGSASQGDMPATNLFTYAFSSTEPEQLTEGLSLLSPPVTWGDQVYYSRVEVEAGNALPMGLVRFDVRTGEQEVLARGEYLWGTVLASNDYVVWREVQDEGPGSVTHVLRRQDGKEVDRWTRGPDIVALQGNILMERPSAGTSPEEQAAELVLRHLPSGREVSVNGLLANPRASVDDFGLADGVLYWTEDLRDEEWNWAGWTVEGADVSAVIAGMNDGSAPASITVAPVRLASGGRESAVLDTVLDDGRLFLVVQEAADQLLYLKRAGEQGEAQNQ